MAERSEGMLDTHHWEHHCSIPNCGSVLLIHVDEIPGVFRVHAFQICYLCVVRPPLEVEESFLLKGGNLSEWMLVRPSTTFDRLRQIDEQNRIVGPVLGESDLQKGSNDPCSVLTIQHRNMSSKAELTWATYAASDTSAKSSRKTLEICACSLGEISLTYVNTIDVQNIDFALLAGDSTLRIISTALPRTFLALP